MLDELHSVVLIVHLLDVQAAYFRINIFNCEHKTELPEVDSTILIGLYRHGEEGVLLIEQLQGASIPTKDEKHDTKE